MESLVVLVSSVAMAIGIATIGLGLLVCGPAGQKTPLNKCETEFSIAGS